MTAWRALTLVMLAAVAVVAAVACFGLLEGV